MSNPAQGGTTVPAVQPNAFTFGYGPHVMDIPAPNNVVPGPNNVVPGPNNVVPAGPAPSPGAGKSPFQQSAGAMRGALGGTAREMMYQPMMVQGGSYSAATAGGGGNIGGNFGYDPMMVEGSGYAAQQLAGRDLSSYMNPYENAVVDQSLQDIDRARQMAANQAAAQATSAGAFGGDREAILQSENNRNFLDQQARTASGLRQQGFMNAQNMALQDIASGNRATEFGLGQRFQADLANQAQQAAADQFAGQSALQAQMANQSSNLQARLASMAAKNRASEFGLTQDFNAALANQGALQAGSAMRLGASGQMAGLSDQAFGQGQAINQQISGQGAFQRALEQALLQGGQGQFDAYRNLPTQNIQGMLAAISGTPMGQTTSRTPGLFDYLTLAANTASAFA